MSKHKRKKEKTMRTFLESFRRDDPNAPEEYSADELAMYGIDTPEAYGLHKHSDGVWRDIPPAHEHAATQPTAAEVNAAIAAGLAVGTAGSSRDNPTPLLAAASPAFPSKPADAWTTKGNVTTTFVKCDHFPTSTIFRMRGVVDGKPHTINLRAFNSRGIAHALAGSSLVIDLAAQITKKDRECAIELPPMFAAWLPRLYTPSAPVMRIDWPDYSVPALVPAFWPSFRDCLFAGLPDGAIVSAGCMGGHGRTGTFLSALYLLSHSDVTVDQAVKIIRTRHCDKAVESKSQLTYLDAIEAYRNAHETPDEPNVSSIPADDVKPSRKVKP